MSHLTMEPEREASIGVIGRQQDIDVVTIITSQQLISGANRIKMRKMSWKLIRVVASETRRP